MHINTSISSSTWVQSDALSLFSPEEKPDTVVGSHPDELSTTEWMISLEGPLSGVCIESLLCSPLCLPSWANNGPGKECITKADAPPPPAWWLQSKMAPVSHQDWLQQISYYI